MCSVVLWCVVGSTGSNWREAAAQVTLPIMDMEPGAPSAASRLVVLAVGRAAAAVEEQEVKDEEEVEWIINVCFLPHLIMQHIQDSHPSVPLLYIVCLYTNIYFLLFTQQNKLW